MDMQQYKCSNIKLRVCYMIDIDQSEDHNILGIDRSKISRIEW